MNKAINTISMCKGANKLSYGETLIRDIKNKEVYLVVICNDTSENSRKKLIDKCNYYKCEYVLAFLQEDLISFIISFIDLLFKLLFNDQFFDSIINEFVKKLPLSSVALEHSSFKHEYIIC